MASSEGGVGHCFRIRLRVVSPSGLVCSARVFFWARAWLVFSYRYVLFSLPIFLLFDCLMFTPGTFFIPREVFAPSTFFPFVSYLTWLSC